MSDKAVSQIHCRRLLDTATVVLECIAAAVGAGVPYGAEVPEQRNLTCADPTVAFGRKARA